MQVHAPDPAYTGSALARSNFRLALKISAAFVGLLWLVALLGWGLDLQQFGVRPREWIGLPGIFVAPLLHAGFVHLVANSVPLLVLGTTMLHLYPRATLKVFAAVYLGPGIAVWLFAASGIHIGASGLVYGLVAYIFVAGLIRRDRRAIAASLLVAFLYGTLVWGVLPIERGVSWQTHLAAALIGVVMAILLRHLDVPPRARYTWEVEAEATGDEDANGDGSADEDVESDAEPGALPGDRDRPTLH
jgi:membrane associated rhomboid family serine protease